MYFKSLIIKNLKLFTKTIYIYNIWFFYYFCNMITGIYKIRNKQNNKVYIGSAVDIKKRWRDHKWNLKENKHHNPHLQF